MSTKSHLGCFIFLTIQLFLLNASPFYAHAQGTDTRPTYNSPPWDADDPYHFWIRVKVVFQGEAPTEFSCERTRFEANPKMHETAFASVGGRVKSVQFRCEPELGKSFTLMFRYRADDNPTQIQFKPYDGKQPWIRSFNQFSVQVTARGKTAEIPHIAHPTFHHLGAPRLHVTHASLSEERGKPMDRIQLFGKVGFKELAATAGRTAANAGWLDFDLRVQTPRLNASAGGIRN